MAAGARTVSGRTHRPRLGGPLLDVILGAVTALALAACGAPSDSSSSPNVSGSSGGLTPVKVAVLPASLSVPVYVGIEQGFFKDEGLDVTATTVAGTAAAVPLLLSDQMQLTVGSPAVFAITASNGVPLQIITGTGTARWSEDPKRSQANISVAGNSPIKGAKDLVGKTIAVPALKGLSHYLVLKWLRAEGVDASKVKIVQLDLPSSLAALLNGKVDAAVMVEPIAANASLKGARPIADISSNIAPGLTEGAIGGSKKYLASHPEVAKAMQRAIAKADDWAEKNPEGVRKIVGRELKVPPELLKVMKIGSYAPAINRDGLKGDITAMQEYGFISRDVQVGQLLDNLFWTAGSKG